MQPGDGGVVERATDAEGSLSSCRCSLGGSVSAGFSLGLLGCEQNTGISSTAQRTVGLSAASVKMTFFDLSR